VLNEQYSEKGNDTVTGLLAELASVLSADEVIREQGDHVLTFIPYSAVSGASRLRINSDGTHEVLQIASLTAPQTTPAESFQGSATNASGIRHSRSIMDTKIMTDTFPAYLK
ncbi:hypothetical protein IGX51_004689, partial [Escherichia coli]|nr:hypothetical protein [Escherichia coli]